MFNSSKTLVPETLVANPLGRSFVRFRAKSTCVYLSVFAMAALVSCQRHSLSEAEVSGYARESFAKAYPAATKVKWEKVDAGYEAEWEIDEVDYGATYASNGQLIETEREFAGKDIPSTVRDAVRRDYGDKAEIEEVAEIARGAEKMYEVEVEVGKKEMEVMYGMDGTKLSEKMED